jgi:hypothetical protein
MRLPCRRAKLLHFRIDQPPPASSACSEALGFIVLSGEQSGFKEILFAIVVQSGVVI